MPTFQVPAVTANFQKVKVNGVAKLTSRVYENGECIYINTEKDPTKIRFLPKTLSKAAAGQLPEIRSIN